MFFLQLVIIAKLIFTFVWFSMELLQILILAIVQGAAELLPVSSSAHVIVAEKLMGLDPTAPQMTLLLVMLHTGTMFAVILYFWKAWRATFF
jgi:undecaprenyl-diphosphatase